MRPDTEPWWRQAEADLTSAELLFSGEHYFTASWYSHQAAEKAIKALYIERFGRDTSRVHDLNLLGRHAGYPSTSNVCWHVSIPLLASHAIQTRLVRRQSIHSR
jgi:HEPN domain-containing protein